MTRSAYVPTLLGFCKLLMLRMNSTDVFGFYLEFPEIFDLWYPLFTSRMVRNLNEDSVDEWSEQRRFVMDSLSDPDLYFDQWIQ